MSKLRVEAQAGYYRWRTQMGSAYYFCLSGKSNEWYIWTNMSGWIKLNIANCSHLKELEYVSRLTLSLEGISCLV